MEFKTTDNISNSSPSDFLKKNIITISAVAISAVAAFFTYKSIVTTRNIDISNRYTESVKLIRAESDRTYRYTKNIFRAFEKYVGNVGSDQAYREKGADTYNVPAEKIRGLVLEINIDELRDELTRIEKTEDGEISESADRFNKFLDRMLLSCSTLVKEYGHIGQTSGTLKNAARKIISVFSEDEELVRRRQEIMMDTFKSSYKKCSDSFNSYKQEREQFLNTYKKILKKI